MKTVFIFRRDLRCYDNNSLNLALRESSEVIPIFIFNPEQVENNDYKSNNSVQFMINSLEDLDSNLKKYGSKLHCFYGNDVDVIKYLVNEKDIKAVSFNKDYTEFSKIRDKKLIDLGLNIFSEEDYLLHRVEDVTHKDSFYKVFTPYYNAAKVIEVDKPDKDTKLLSKLSKINIKKSKYSFSLDEAKKFYTNNSSIAVFGSRSEGLDILNNKDTFKKYENNRDIPSISTTKASAYLKFGSISVREFYDAFKDNDALIRQLYWRDYFAYVTHFQPNILNKEYNEKLSNIDWNSNEKDFDSWKNGETGIPIIDAGMRELNETGWLHNRVRMLTAFFLVKNLFIDWKKGAKYFAQKLVDYCPMQNQNNWQSAFGSGISAQPWFRVMNPQTQQKKFDENCEYIKKWIPELRNKDSNDIHNFDVSYCKQMLDLQESARKFKQKIKESI
jgi:deoxyribodipyrimidine photo-lyase